jgi:HK97 family phage major capsid protein
MPATSLTEIREELAEKRRFLHDVFKQAGPDLDMTKVTLLSGDTHSKAGEIKRLNDELTALGQEHDRLYAVSLIGRENEQEHRRLNEPGGSGLPTGSGGAGEEDGRYGDRQLTPRRLREVLQTSKAYKQFRDGSLREATIDLPAGDLKALINLTAISPQVDRRPMVMMPLEERTVGDLMLQGTTTVGSLEYYEETTSPVPTPAQAAVLEGTAKFEDTFGWTLQSETVRKIGTWVPATKEALDDVDFLESQIRGRLAFAVQRVEEQMLLTGTGTAPQLRGLLNRTGIQTTAKTTGVPIPDVIYTAMQLVRGSAGTGFAEPTGVVFNPTNWTTVKLLRTADGIYIWGNPSEEGPDRIWGLPVRQTTAMTVNTALVGAFRPHAEIIRRQGVTVTLSTEHASYFIENKVAILAEERLALAVYRPSAFATATALNVV